MKKLIKYLSIIGIIGLSASCQKQESKIEILANINPPTLTTVPTISFTKDMANDTVVFEGTKVNPGFTASATYYLEVDTAGDNFANAIILASDIQDSKIKFAVSALNNALLNTWNPYVSNNLEFRIRAVLDQTNAGAGVPPIVSTSPSASVSAVLYGLPQLNLVGSGTDQNVQSANSDGSYTGYVKLDATKPFTLTDPVSGDTYGKGASDGSLALSGTAISAPASGWYSMKVNTVSKTYSIDPYMIGIIGTFDNWSAPDPKLDYNKKKGYWYITVTLDAGGFKFRGNDTWGAINIGESGSSKSLASLVNDGSSGNIASPGAGTYFITLTIGSPNCSCTITPVK
jgi:hypothetical protein